MGCVEFSIAVFLPKETGILSERSANRSAVPITQHRSRFESEVDGNAKKR
jgi:hypothetical protein